MALTNPSIRNTKPAAKPIKLSDGEGLVLLVQPTQCVARGQLRYRFSGKEKMLALDTYPDVRRHFPKHPSEQRQGQGVARARHRPFMRATRTKKQRKAIALMNCFEAVARQWWADWRQVRSPRHAHYVIRRLEADIFL